MTGQFRGCDLLQVCREALQGKGRRRELHGGMREGGGLRDGYDGPTGRVGSWIGCPRGEGDMQNIRNDGCMLVLLFVWSTKLV